MLDCLLYANFKFSLGFDSVSNSSAQLLEAGWVYEQEVSFEGLFVDLDGALYVYFDDGDFASLFNPVEFLVCSAVLGPGISTLLFDELPICHHLLEGFVCHKDKVLLSLLQVFTSLGSCGVRFLSLEQIPVALEDVVNQCLFADT